MTPKKTIKIRDLKPAKDAKGGGTAINRPGVSHTGTNSAGANSKHAAHGPTHN